MFTKNAPADWLHSWSAGGFYLVTCYLEDLLSISQSRHQFRLQDVPAASHLVGGDKSLLDALAYGTFLASEHAGDIGHGINGVRGIYYAVVVVRGITHTLVLPPMVLCRRILWAVPLSIHVYLQMSLVQGLADPY